MNQIIHTCSCKRIDDSYCSLTPTCKGWGCRFLSTPIDGLPKTDKEKAIIFSKVYREAKVKGVLECPYYRSLFIDEVLENINEIEQNFPMRNMSIY